MMKKAGGQKSRWTVPLRMLSETNPSEPLIQKLDPDFAERSIIDTVVKYKVFGKPNFRILILDI